MRNVVTADSARRGRSNMEGITQDSVNKMAKKLKQEKSFWYKVKVNREFLKLNKAIAKVSKKIDRGARELVGEKIDLQISQKKLLDTGLITDKTKERCSRCSLLG